MIRPVSPEHVLKSETYTMVFLWCRFFYTSETQELQKNRGGPNIRDDGSGPA